MIPLIKWGLWQRRISTIAWSFGTAAFVFITMIFYPSFRDSAEEFNQGFSDLPDTAVNLFGGSADFATPIGFMNSQIFFILLPLIFGILAINLGQKLLSSEEQNGTIELLLSRPVSRMKILLSKALLTILILGISAVFTLIVMIITAEAISLEISNLYLAQATLVCYLLALSFGAIAFLLSAIGRTRGLSIGIASVIAFGGYLLTSLSGTVTWLEGPSKLLPFHYYQSEEILLGMINWANLIYFAGLILFCWLVSQYIFNNRDIG